MWSCLRFRMISKEVFMKNKGSSGTVSSRLCRARTCRDNSSASADKACSGGHVELSKVAV